MAKPNPYLEKMMVGIERKVYDDNALTVNELAGYLGLSRSQTSDMCKKRTESGEWERVWRKTGIRPVPAYRPAK